MPLFTQQPQQDRKHRTTDNICHNINGLSTYCFCNGFIKFFYISRNDDSCSKLTHFLFFAGTNNRRNSRSTNVGQLNQARTNATRGTCNQNCLSLSQPGTIQHMLASYVSGRKSGKFGITQWRLDHMRVVLWSRSVLGKTAIPLTAHKTCLKKPFIIASVQGRVNYHTLTYT